MHGINWKLAGGLVLIAAATFAAIDVLQGVYSKEQLLKQGWTVKPTA